MRKDLISFKPVNSSFLTCDKDIMIILKSLFVTTKPYSDLLKRLLVINSKDCLDVTNQDYQKLINDFSLGKMMEQGYIRLNPKITRGTHEEIKSYILVSLDGFTPNVSNPQYLDYNINFDVVCYNDAWVLNDYKIRPLMICGYIDGILNSITSDNLRLVRSHQPNIKLTGVGEYRLLGCNEVVLNEDLSMYTLAYHGMHFNEDIQKLGDVHAE